MFLFKVLSFVSVAIVAASASGQPAQYPAGVNPALCPGFPVCDNARLHDPKAANALPIHDNPLWNAHAVPGVPTTLAQPAPVPVAVAAPRVIEDGQYDERWNDPNFKGEAAPVVASQPQWNAAPVAQPQWNAAPVAQPQWNAAPVAQPQWNAAPAPVWNFAPSHVQQQFSEWRGPQPQAYVAPQPQAYSAPQPQAYAAPQPHAVSEDGAGGDKYPAGVNPQACPNYPYCDTNTGVVAGVVAAPKAAPLPGYTERQYPAGVSPQQCPNFPYCG